MPFWLKRASVELKKMVQPGGEFRAREFANGISAAPVTVEFQYLVPDARSGHLEKQVSSKPVRNTGGKTVTRYRILGPRPTRVSGIVLPTTTKGRKAAPEPCCGVRVEGAKDVNRGHLFALELGGEDSSWNIVPQWGIWQQQDEWRRMETGLKDRAEKLAASYQHGTTPSSYLVLTVDVQYLKSPHRVVKPRLAVWGFPSRFKVTIVEYDNGQPGMPEVQDFEGSHVAEKDICDDDLSYLRDYVPTLSPDGASPTTYAAKVDDDEIDPDDVNAKRGAHIDLDDQDADNADWGEEAPPRKIKKVKPSGANDPILIADGGDDSSQGIDAEN